MGAQVLSSITNVFPPLLSGFSVIVFYQNELLFGWAVTDLFSVGGCFVFAYLLFPFYAFLTCWAFAGKEKWFSLLFRVLSLLCVRNILLPY